MEPFYILKGKNFKAIAIINDTSTDASKTTLSKPSETTSKDWSSWGDDNLFPQNVLGDLEGNSIALRALEKRKNVHYGRGISAYIEVEGQKVSVLNPKDTTNYRADIAEFFRVNRIQRQWIDAIGSLEIFANGFVEFITNKEKSAINKVYVKDPCYCRWEVMNDSSNRIENMYYSANWDKSTADPVKIPTYNPEKIKNNKYADGKFIYPIFYKSFNKSYYHLAIWNGVRKNGWLSISNKVPSMKLAIMKNQMDIKYHIEIPWEYFEQRYPNPKFNDAQREEKLQEKIGELNDFLTDVENSGKALVTLSYWDKQMKQKFPGWEIKVIDNKLKDDAYLPDSQAANSEILAAIGIDPCLLSNSSVPGGGGKMGAGSGSDKREAFWMLNAEMGPYRTVSLEPLYFVRDFNGWGEEVQFDYIVVDTSQTQSEHPSKINQNVDSNSNQ